MHRSTDNKISKFDVLRGVLESTESNFYRNVYGEKVDELKRISQEKDEKMWRNVPFLSRGDIQRFPLDERLYVPHANLDAIRVTSGTSGGGILTMPRMSLSVKHKEHLTSRRVKKMATFSGGHFLYAKEYKKELGIDSIQLDPANIKTASLICEKYNPDVLFGFPYALSSLAPMLSKNSAGSVRAVCLFGEWCSNLQWQFLHDAFPNAIMVSEYASIDSQMTLAGPCEEIISLKERYVHSFPDFVDMELIDLNSGEVINEGGILGELIITVLHPVALPLVRYKTGDVGKIVRKECKCGIDTPILFIEGRMDADKIRFSGGEIHVAEVDRALSNCKEYLISDDFQVTLSEVEHLGSLKPKVTTSLKWNREIISPENISSIIEKEILIRPNYTYAQGVKDGILAPLEVKFKTSDDTNSGKKTRMIRER
jgi:phenylacetate-coenzyme A ligase PaaK-like adenylate-forming protein